MNQNYYWIIRIYNGEMTIEEDYGPLRSKGNAYWRMEKLIYAHIYDPYQWLILFGTLEEIQQKVFNIDPIYVRIIYTKEELSKLNDKKKDQKMAEFLLHKMRLFF